MNPPQSEFDFNGPRQGVDGVSAWRTQRDPQMAELARANGIPLNHRCRLELQGDVVLEGIVRLADEELLMPGLQRNPELQLRVDRCRFRASEILSIVRVD